MPPNRRLMSASGFFRLVACLALCLAVGIVGSRATYPEIAGWYASLAKPNWTPPNSAFPAVWTMLYVLMAVSVWLLWQRGAEGLAKFKAVVLFAAQLVLNAAWPPVFFALHQIRFALVTISLLALTIAAFIVTAWRVDRMAALLLVPYLVWVIYATALNAAIAVLNP
jgi:benzodiazapine receptor